MTLALPDLFYFHLDSTGDEIIYEGKETSYVVSGLEEMTEYSFKVRAWTHGDEESAVSNVAKAATFRAGLCFIL